MSRDIARELRRTRFASGGRGVVCFVDQRRRPLGRDLLSERACAALERAAGRLGFGNSWRGVVDAIAHWALPDVLSEAIEEQESNP